MSQVEPTAGVTRPAPAGCLTDAEHRAIDLTAELWNLLCLDVIGGGESRAGDTRELCALIHGIQRMVMGQAAARAHPDRYRLLGETLKGPRPVTGPDDPHPTTGPPWVDDRPPGCVCYIREDVEYGDLWTQPEGGCFAHRHPDRLSDIAAGDETPARMNEHPLPRAPGRPPPADLLRMAAAGQREYASGLPADDRHRYLLEREAATLDSAARLVDGDLQPLYGWLPARRWTAEMHAMLDGAPAGDPLAAAEPAPATNTLNLAGIDEFVTLTGDEDGGAGLGCRACWDGGRPLAYLAGVGAAHEDDAAVEKVATMTALLAAGARHIATGAHREGEERARLDPLRSCRESSPLPGWGGMRVCILVHGHAGSHRDCNVPESHATWPREDVTVDATDGQM